MEIVTIVTSAVIALIGALIGAVVSSTRDRFSLKHERQQLQILREENARLQKKITEYEKQATSKPPEPIDYPVKRFT